ncbi:MAG: binding-protein-dependent transport system inner rane component [Proteobacteria bacterium]|nr:binding-protein-dependent transport system inner rane component [Pseudomonadota bacterium]
MMPRLRDRNGGDWLFGTLGLVLLMVGWSLVNRVSGPFVLPSLSETAEAFLGLFASGSVGRELAVTLLHAVGGAVLGALIGFLLGLAGGMRRSVGATLRPAATAILGIPPVAWVVLALLWFGPGLWSPLFTVTVTTAPILFASTLQGVEARDRGLIEMAEVFKLSRRTRLFRLLLPELAVHVAPALSTTFALAWKVALTAEVLGDGSGVGGAFSTARAHLDLAEAMAWIWLVVIFLLVTDGLLLGPLRRWIRGNRASGQAAREGGPTCVGIGYVRERS